MARRGNADPFSCTVTLEMENAERARMAAEAARSERWSHWGPYVSNRQWGTVREDYSADGSSWTYFPFEAARTRAYRWGEDGIFGLCDHRQRLCFAPAFWNGNDAILKERFFGLGGTQGNHGEDVKELYYHLDNLPSHAYQKALYKYPQRAFPYDDLIATNAARTRADPEYELVDTGIFAYDAYFDVSIEYAKDTTDDISIRFTIVNRAPEPATLHLVPQWWFRNEWSWAPNGPHGTIVPDPSCPNAYVATHPELGRYRLRADRDVPAFFTENETNFGATFGTPGGGTYCKDGIDRAIVRGELAAVNPQRTGSKLGLQYVLTIAARGTHVVRLRLSPAGATCEEDFGPAFDALFTRRAGEADAFYEDLNPYPSGEDRHRIQRAALAGMLWSKQFYFYVVRDWLAGDPLQPKPPDSRLTGRNAKWPHLYNDAIISMPDTWEYPWYASWDLGFHAVTFALIDAEFAKRQMLLLTREWYMNPSGQIPAYEYAFGDANPPVQAWAAYRIFQIDRRNTGVGDYEFLERVFQKLLLNFTWWVNREDPDSINVFMGGFLGLDNIGVFDRSQPVPGGGRILESDATSWMCVYALDMMSIAFELTAHDEAYEDIATKFFEHFLYISAAMNGDGRGDLGLWDEEQGFYFDQLVAPDGDRYKLQVRSLVGLLPLLAVATLRPSVLARMPRFAQRVDWTIANRPELVENVASMDVEGQGERRLLSMLSADRLKRILGVMLDEEEFLSDHGIRSVSKYHKDHPFVFNREGTEFRVDYEPGESTSGSFGGNSNWRGPVWMPLNYLIVEALQHFHFFYGDTFKVACPTGSNKEMTLWDVATDLSQRLVGLFERDENGRRPFYGDAEPFRSDPHFGDLLMFYEYFHADTGKGLGACAQTGWTGIVAKLIQQTSEYVSGGKSPREWTPERNA